MKEPTHYEPTRSSARSTQTYIPGCKIDREIEHRMKLADRARTLANEVRADKTKAFEKREWAQLKKDFYSMYRHCLIQNTKRGVDLVAPDDSMISPCRNITSEAIEVARDLFMDVHGRDAKNIPLQHKPEFECRINTSCKKCSFAQMVIEELAVSASSSQVVDIEGKQVLRASFSRLKTYTADTGAAIRVKDKKELGPEELKRVNILKDRFLFQQ